MSLSAGEFLLILFKEWDGRISGRTVLQKRAYFVQRLTKKDVVRFNPHFFGPFSPEIDAAVARLCELGFVKEDQRRFDTAGLIRYDYSLTADGERLADTVVRSHANFKGEVDTAVARISDSGQLDSQQLALAAKISHIVQSGERPLTAQEISTRAEELGWHVGPEKVRPVAIFLESLGLISRRKGSSA